MQNYYHKEAIQIARKMIKAFFIEKNVDSVLSYVNPDKFTWIGSGENEILTDIDDIRAYFQTHCNTVNRAYKLISEEYKLGGESGDSCVVIAKIKFQGMNDRQNYQSSLHFSFYVQLLDGELKVSHYHVHIPIKRNQFNHAANFMINRDIDSTNELLQMDLQYQSGLLSRFLNSSIAMKSFCYDLKNGLPYCYVNQPFLSLIGFQSLKNFIAQDKISSLAHIHPDDQQRYLQNLKARIPQPLILTPAQEWQWHASYHIIYRTQTFDKAEQTVFEFGNVLTLNGNPIVNSFVFPLERYNNYNYPPPYF